MRHGLLLRASFGFALLVGATTLSTAAWAADPTPQDIAQARDLGQQAQAQFDAGNFAQSEKLWAGATNLYPAAPTLTLGLARTQAKLGKLVLAQESYNRIIRENGQNPNPPPAFKAALEAANAEVGAVSAKIAGVVITVDGAPNPTVTIDGLPISAAVLGLKRPVDPGSHTVKAEAAGYKPVETTFQVAESATAEAKLKLEKSSGPLVAATEPQAQPTQPDTSTTTVDTTKKSSRKTLAVVALGVGGAGLIFGGVTGVLAMGKHGDLADQCKDGTCPNTSSGDVDSYKTMGLLSTVGFIVGGVGLAAGAVLWFTAPKEKTTASYRTVTPRASNFSWQPYVGTTGGGVTGSF